ncbi:D-amino-acid transaminase [Ketogulonicigenium vulgare]|uniref:Probable branched-chain-amino-acid aminotransferase n=1 Tax=Ketogulonicigenium vulgare (strain WSH-001) TaxID=759362 RepID=F9Y899_KETVW|nr:D-amino-acid transaminase [Ketogulonicigenium vulgare]ADO41535.1 aminotransferase, class IV [Ketogulonicigenium vulgare Y25]AEM42385.1 Aminotransferase, class IV [Ketogulonicigenium vulgare WSH-001]ALJ80007.1 D-amino acid aminotransferase [Ketogulonicigenium vulgare]ANW32894.1 D-amino acid aminotransferase [Ketogulonicigenium vulgare]AOZ53469.1 aminotransferase, class IV [Ketogulonicigenium vulgare]
MTRTVYVNGEYLPETEAKVSIFDRGFVMGDAVYEVTAVVGGKLLDFAGHEARLARSLNEIEIENPFAEGELLAIHRELLAKNELVDGGIYLQVTRGNPGDRDFVFPDPAVVKPTVVLYTQLKPGVLQSPTGINGIRVISVPEMRWHRRDIKTVQLLYPSMAKMMAKKAGVDDAWFVEDGFVTEGSSNNTYIVKDGAIITRPLSQDLLHGITRAALLRYANEAQIKIIERPFTIAEAQAADEAFLTSASAFVTPVIEVDGAAIGAGTPGPIAKRLREIYIDEALKAGI